MTTLHEARIERAARLVAEAETARAEAWDAADIARAALTAARDASDAARWATWAADSALFSARESQAKANAEGE